MSNNVSFVFYPKRYYSDITALVKKNKWKKRNVMIYKRGFVKVTSNITSRRASIAKTILHKVMELQADEIASRRVVPGVPNDDLKRPLVEPQVEEEVKQIQHKPLNFVSKPNNEPYVFNSGYSR